MATAVQGNQFVLLAFKGDGYYPFACTQELTLTVDTELLPATSVNSGNYHRFKPGLSTWKVSTRGITYIHDESGKYLVLDTLLSQVRREGLDLKIVFEDDLGVRYITGHIYIQTTDISKTSGQLSKYGLEMMGDGAFFIDQDNILPTSSLNVKKIQYTATGGETEISDPDLIGREIVGAFRESCPVLKVITSGTPNDKQTLYDSANGKCVFTALMPGEQVLIQYK